MALPRSVQALCAAFVGSGVVHLVRPQVYLPVMPPWVPAHREVIYASGVAELVCAAGMAHPRTRRAAGWASVALLLGVFPANVQMVQDAVRRGDRRLVAIAVARLPFQLPMVRAALRAARS